MYDSGLYLHVCLGGGRTIAFGAISADPSCPDPFCLPLNVVYLVFVLGSCANGKWRSTRDVRSGVNYDVADPV